MNAIRLRHKTSGLEIRGEVRGSGGHLGSGAAHAGEKARLREAARRFRVVTHRIARGRDSGVYEPVKGKLHMDHADGSCTVFDPTEWDLIEQVRQYWSDAQIKQFGRRVREGVFAHVSRDVQEELVLARAMTVIRNSDRDEVPMEAIDELIEKLMKECLPSDG